jgi:uncharacterized membrane protein YphA (DoxX/SURF4 family)
MTMTMRTEAALDLSRLDQESPPAASAISRTAGQQPDLDVAARVTAAEAKPRRLITTLLWAAQILLAAFFLFAAGPKLAGSHDSVHEFGLIGAGQWFRYLVGVLELGGAIGLLTPWLAGPAAAGLAADMAGATIINATVLHNTEFGVNVWMTALLCAVFVLLAYGRRQQIKDLAAAIRRYRRRRAPGART